MAAVNTEIIFHFLHFSCATQRCTALHCTHTHRHACTIAHTRSQTCLFLTSRVHRKVMALRNCSNCHLAFWWECEEGKKVLLLQSFSVFSSFSLSFSPKSLSPLFISFQSTEIYWCTSLPLNTRHSRGRTHARAHACTHARTLTIASCHWKHVQNTQGGRLVPIC